MNQQQLQKHKFKNLAQTLLLIGSMSVLLALCANLLFGGDAWIGVLTGLLLAMVILPGLSPDLMLRLYQARRIDYRAAPQLVSMNETLAQRAGLERAPTLYWVPSRTLNAFTVGNAANSSLALTDGLLRLLSQRELGGVLAHEISHIRNHDLYLMTLADMITRMTHILSLIGLVLIILAIPVLLLTDVPISISGLLLLVISPWINALLQLGLSRVREFDADLDAARLSGDPQGLVSALARIEQHQANPWSRLIMPGYREVQPSILRSHPHTRERIDRLQQLRPTYQGQYSTDPISNVPQPFRYAIKRPRQRFFSGTWR